MVTLRSALLVVAPLGVLLISGCTDRTNCRAMQKRFDACSEQLWNALEPGLKGRVSDGWRQSKNAQHFQYCQKVKGRYKQSAAINGCLAKEGCNKFASCFCQAVKKKGCGQP
jgi:hypothetical protein